MNSSRVWSLAIEMLQILDAGRIGLYEFVDFQRGDDDFDLPTARAVAKSTLSELLELDAVQLVWLRWANGNYESPASMGDVDRVDPWEDIGDDPYLGVVSTQDRDSRIALVRMLDEQNRDRSD